MVTKRPGDWLFIVFVLGLMTYAIGVEVLRIRALWNLGSVAPRVEEKDRR